MTTTRTPVANRFQPIDPQPDALPMPNQTDKMRIPIHAGHLFRDEAGHHSDLIPATVPR